jgi:SAM-dependent methyltransferase
MNTREQWQLTMEAAELYERYPARYILGPWAPLLVEAARLTAGERVLDIACGTGVVTRAAAKRVSPTGRIVGIDLNPGMIAVARSLPAPIGASIEWLERSAQNPVASWVVPSEDRTLPHHPMSTTFVRHSKFGWRCLSWVIFVRSTRFRRPRHVRFAPIASEPSHRSNSTRCARS